MLVGLDRDRNFPHFEFKVIWETIVMAESAVEAARQALRIQRNPDSLEIEFHVHPVENPANATHVDLIFDLHIPPLCYTV